MLIEFIKNPDFTPQPPPIRVGSVVSDVNGKKCLVILVPHASSNLHVRYNAIDNYTDAAREFVTPLPLRVSGITPDGEWEYAPLDPSPTSFSWDDYPPKAGMVVEYDQRQYRVLLTDGEKMIAVNKDGEVRGSARREGDSFVPEMKDHEYLPRPDLMPRFVTEGKR